MDIEELRSRIETADYQILELIRKRSEIAEEIGKIKKESGLPTVVPEVEKKVISRYREFASSNDMDPDDLEELCRIIMTIAKKKEE